MNNNENIIQNICKNKSLYSIKTLDINTECAEENILFKDFIPSCRNLQILNIAFLPQNFDNFLKNIKQLKQQEFGCNINSLNNFGKIIEFDYTTLEILKICLCLDEFEEIEKADFSFIKKLKNLKSFHICFSLDDDNEEEVLPIGLIESLNSLNNLEFLKIENDNYCLKMENINKLKIKTLKTLIIDSNENIDYESIINYHSNLNCLFINYDEKKEDEIPKKIIFPQNIKEISLRLGGKYIVDGPPLLLDYLSAQEKKANPVLMYNLFNFIQEKQCSLIELNLAVHPMYGYFDYNFFLELSKCFKNLQCLKNFDLYAYNKKALMSGKKCDEWIKNIKYLKNLEQFILRRYKMSLEELTIFIDSIENLEFLVKVQFLCSDNDFELDQIVKLINTKNFPPRLIYFNLLPNVKHKENQSDSEDESFDDKLITRKYHYPIFK